MRPALARRGTKGPPHTHRRDRRNVYERRCLPHHWFAHWGYPLVPNALRGAQQPARAVHSNQRFLGSRADRPHVGLMTPPPKQREGAPHCGLDGGGEEGLEADPPHPSDGSSTATAMHVEVLCLRASALTQTRPAGAFGQPSRQPGPTDRPTRTQNQDACWRADTIQYWCS